MNSVVLVLPLACAAGTAVSAQNNLRTDPYFAGVFARACNSVNQCMDNAQQTGRDVCTKLGYRFAVTPSRPEEVLVTVSGNVQVSFTWSAPVNCSNQQF